MTTHIFSYSSFSGNFSNKERDIMFFAQGPRRFSILCKEKWKSLPQHLAVGQLV